MGCPFELTVNKKKTNKEGTDYQHISVKCITFGNCSNILAYVKREFNSDYFSKSC